MELKVSNLGNSFAKIEADLYPDIEEIEELKISYIFDEQGLSAIYLWAINTEGTTIKNGVMWDRLNRLFIATEMI